MRTTTALAVAAAAILALGAPERCTRAVDTAYAGLRLRPRQF
jgi:hypothetical protein